GRPHGYGPVGQEEDLTPSLGRSVLAGGVGGRERHHSPNSPTHLTFAPGFGVVERWDEIGGWSHEETEEGESLPGGGGAGGTWQVGREGHGSEGLIPRVTVEGI
ncbi:unnamed protein product, partial [Choristocarpus tenellus]